MQAATAGCPSTKGPDAERMQRQPLRSQCATLSNQGAHGPDITQLTRKGYPMAIETSSALARAAAQALLDGEGLAPTQKMLMDSLQQDCDAGGGR